MQAAVAFRKYRTHGSEVAAGVGLGVDKMHDGK